MDGHTLWEFHHCRVSARQIRRNEKEEMDMPNLRCTATTCYYNTDNLCSKGDIKVDGAQATAADETSCASFRERSQFTNQSCSSCGCKTIQVDCKACSCVYNENEQCAAGSVDIAGTDACSSQDTRCGTFQCK